MVKIDKEKFKNCKGYSIILRPDFGKSPSIEVDCIKKVYVDDEDYISSVDYVNPYTFRSHWCYGHQVDDILYKFD